MTKTLPPAFGLLENIGRTRVQWRREIAKSVFGYLSEICTLLIHFFGHQEISLKILTNSKSFVSQRLYLRPCKLATCVGDIPCKLYNFLGVLSKLKIFVGVKRWTGLLPVSGPAYDLKQAAVFKKEIVC